MSCAKSCVGIKLVCIWSAGPGLDVTEALLDKDGTVQKQIFMHTAFLLSVSADSRHARRWPCGHLWQHTLHLAGIFLRASKGNMMVPRVLRATQKQQSRSSLNWASAKSEMRSCSYLTPGNTSKLSLLRMPEQKSGCKGYSEFPRILSYVSYSDVWEPLIHHAGKQVCLVVHCNTLAATGQIRSSLSI